MASPPLPSSSEQPKKPHLPFPDKPSNSQKIPIKSHSNSSSCKTLIILFLLLLLIPFFPSQAPDFIAQNLPTQFWEIVHLLFVGIAVSYGLFGRRSAPKFQISRLDDDDDDPQAYLSGISHLSSIFEDGPGEQEQDLMQGYYANCDCHCFGDSILGQSGCAVHGGSIGAEVPSFVSNNGREDVMWDGNEKNNVEKRKNQTWSSKYSKGESLVVVANADGGSLDFKPLNLPVRSLRSNVVGSHQSEPTSLEIEARDREDAKVQKIRGVVPTKLEKGFKDPNGLSPIPWRSRSVRMGNDDDDDDEEEESNAVKPRVHCRPHSVGDVEFERIMSRPSNEVQRLSTSPELRNLRKGDAEGENVTSVPHPKIAPLTGFGHRNCEEHKEVGKGKQPIEPLQVHTKPLAFRGKALPRRAKSVRTIKPTRHTVTNQKAEKPLVYRQHEEVDHRFSMTKPKPKPSLPDFFMEEDIVDQNVTKESEADRVSELKDSSDEEKEKEDEEENAKTNIDYDLGSEVDRKAGEFIAKFREQIRRQKASSSLKGHSQEFL